VNRKSWKQFNNCKTSHVQVTKLSDEVLKQCKLKRLQAQMKACRRLTVRTIDIMTIPEVVKRLKPVPVPVPIPEPEPQVEAEPSSNLIDITNKTVSKIRNSLEELNPVSHQCHQVPPSKNLKSRRKI
jgi:hypothetical protein